MNQVMKKMFEELSQIDAGTGALIDGKFVSLSPEIIDLNKRISALQSEADLDEDKVLGLFKESLSYGADDRLIKPSGYNTGTLKGFPNEDTYDLTQEEELFRDFNAVLDESTSKLTREEYLSRGWIGSYDATFLPLDAKRLPETFVHDVTTHSALKNLKDWNNASSVGCSDKDFPTYMKSLEFTEQNPDLINRLGVNLIGGVGYHTSGLRLLVDRDSLIKTRNIFHDYEGFDLPEEGNSTYIVFGGIPYQAIKNVELLSESGILK